VTTSNTGRVVSVNTKATAGIQNELGAVHEPPLRVTLRAVSMKYDPAKHHRRSIRLRDYDYTQAGAYFVTICTQDRQPVLGEVVHGEMVLSDPGQTVQTIWREMPQHYPGAEVDAFVVMPNHVHGIIILVGATPRVGATPCGCPESSGQARGPAPTRPLSLADVVHRFKSLTTARYRLGVPQDGWQAFPGRLWQRNYYEHIIRDEEELNRIRQYITDNPARWDDDPENPEIGA
jgi:putative transposase